VIAYADGEIRQEFNITYLGRVVGGTITVSDESTDVRFIDPSDFDDIPIHDTVRLRLRHHAEHRDHPYLG